MNRSILNGAFAVVLSILTGCVFMPTQERLRATEPVSASAPRPTAAPLPSLETRHFELGSEQELVGDVQVLFARYENTLTLIAREYDVGYEELRLANPGVDAWLPGEGTPVYLPTLKVLPDAPRQGVVLNLPSMRLWFFSAAAAEGAVRSVTTHPIGIGREGWSTPTGQAVVTTKARDPVWYPPASVRAEHAELGDPLPSVVPAGPDNPLGKFALALSLPGYLIHGTNKPAGVGMRVSHGCIRLYPEDIEALFDRVARGTPVMIVNQPILAGWRDAELYLEVYPQLAEGELDVARETRKALDAALARAGRTDAEIDWDIVRRVVEEKRGMPFPILKSERSLEEYLASARVIENRTRIGSEETAANVVE